jgi:hypothetical protein
MVDMFMETHKKEKNENTAFILMLGVLSEKLSEIVKLLQNGNKNLDLIKDNLDFIDCQKKEVKDIKFHTPLSSEDYD